MLEITVIETPQGMYISEKATDRSTYRTATCFVSNQYRINGQQALPSFHNEWVIVYALPKKIEEKKSQPNINQRYELKDSEMESEKIPAVLTYDEATYIDEDGDRTFKPKYQDYASLYQYTFDKQPDIWVEVEFKIVAHVKFDEIQNVKGFAYPIFKTKWKHQGDTVITQKNVQHQLLDKILFPSILLPTRPCRLTSKQSYDIVRHFILKHIDPRVDTITSDYDFCFTVKKYVHLNDPYINRKEILKSNGRSYAKPRYKENYVKANLIEVFEMTHDESQYKKYTVLPGFEADNVEALGDKIEAYLKDLIAKINEPLKECPHCKGYGTVKMSGEELDNRK